MPKRRYSGVVIHFVHRFALCFVTGGAKGIFDQIRYILPVSFFTAIGVHGAKFEEGEFFAQEPHPLLFEQNGTTRGDLYQHRDHEHHRRKKDDPDQGTDDIDASFYPFARVGKIVCF